MGKKYRATFGFGVSIRCIEIERETEKTIHFYIESYGTKTLRMEHKHTIRTYWFGTWREAHNWLLDRARGKVENARAQLKIANDLFGNVKGMREPSDD